MLALVFSYVVYPKQDLSRLPIGGFTTANIFNGSWTEEDLYEQLRVLCSQEYPRYGYDYFVIDDGWMLAERDENGDLQVDPEKFTHGMELFSDMVHQYGMKLGIYASAGSKTCLGGAGSIGFEYQDVALFKRWNVDYLKYDFCYSPLDGEIYAPDIVDLSVGGVVYGISDCELIG